jgi:hypothetical protein
MVLICAHSKRIEESIKGIQEKSEGKKMQVGHPSLSLRLSAFVSLTRG